MPETPTNDSQFESAKPPMDANRPVGSKHDDVIRSGYGYGHPKDDMAVEDLPLVPGGPTDDEIEEQAARSELVRLDAETSLREMDERFRFHKSLWWALALGLFGALAAIAVLAYLYQEDGTPSTISDVASQPELPAAQPTTPATVAEAPGTVDTAESPPPGEPDVCEVGTGCDAAGDNGGSRLTGQASDELRAAGDALRVGWRKSSHIFSLTVAGDGQALAMSESTKWFNPRFVVNGNPDGTFAADGYVVDGDWGRGREFEGKVFDTEFRPIPDVEVTAEWIDSSTVEIAVIGLPIEEAPNWFVMELAIRLLKPDGTNGVDMSDDAYWGTSR